MILKIKPQPILKNIQFLKLWGNQLLLQVSFNMCNYTALLILADRTHSPFVQAQLYAALTLPAFIFGLVAGPVVDMVDRKKLMLITDGLLAFLFLSYAFAGANTVVIMIIAFLTSSVARFFIPAEAATIPLMVSEETLEHANTFFLFTLMGSVLLGYAIAGPIIQLFGGLRSFGETAPFILSSILLAIGFILRLTLKKVEAVKPRLPKGTIFKKTFHLFKQTIGEVKSHENIYIPIVLLIFVEFIVGTMSILFLEFVNRYLRLEITSVSYVLMGPLVVGLITGVFLLSRIEKIWGHIKSILMACFGVGMVLLFLGLTPFIAGTLIIIVATIAGAFLLGLAIVVIAVQARTILQINARIEMHGRIFSFLDIMIAFITPVPVLILGFLADKISILVVLSAIGLLIMTTTFLISRRRGGLYVRTS